MPLAPGARLGTYEILAFIGAGGMGEVWRARDTRLSRDVALKILPESFASDPDRLARFEREARLLASLNHPNIGAIYGFEERALVLELVEGETLADRIALGPISLERARPIARQIAEALDAAHERGIVHRDLKPANIKLRADGTVKLLDFGLAKALEPESIAQLDVTASPTMTSPAMTRLGVVLGTAAYMSPEQARGQAIDRRTDIWAFGCVLYEMLTGRRAFERPSVADTAAAILEREPDWSALPASTPVGVRQLLHRCLEKDRRQRLRDIGDARYEFEVVESGPTASGTLVVARQRSRALRLSAGVAILAAVLVTVAVWWARRDGQVEAGPSSLAPSSLGPTFTRLTHDASFSTEPAISRDGEFVVYASDRAGGEQLDLWLQHMAGGEPRRLTSDPSSDERAPDFSPDGGRIAFRSDRSGGGIYVMSTSGGDALPVAEGGRGPRFSPNKDVARIAYWTGASLAGRRENGHKVFTVPATGGGQSEPVAPGFITAHHPVWSPDSRSLLFFGRKSDKPPYDSFDWWWAPLDGREPVATGVYPVLERRGLLGRDFDEPNQLFDAIATAWTQAGVLFSARLGDSVNLWRVQVSERSGAVVETSLRRLTFSPALEMSASVDDANRIAFQMNDLGAVSLTLPLDSNAGKPIGNGAVVRHTFDVGVSQRNSLDYDGQRLVYSKHRANESEIWVKDLNNGGERLLVQVKPPSPIDPVISRDGAFVGYTKGEGLNRTGWVVPSSGHRGPRRVCEGCSLQGWFEDNRRLLVLAEGKARALDITDGRTTDLVSGVTGRLDLSPDERWLSFGARDNNENRNVWIAPIRPGKPTPESEWILVLAKPAPFERACGWSPNGELLYLLLERDGFRDLYAQRIDKVRGRPVGDPFPVYHLHDPRRRGGSTPFGTAIVKNWFLFNQVEMTGSIWLLTPPAATAAK